MKLIEGLEEDNREFYNGNDEAGTRLRNKLREVKKKAKEIIRKIPITYRDTA